MWQALLEEAAVAHGRNSLFYLLINKKN